MLTTLHVDYRPLMPMHAAEDVFLAWIDKLDRAFAPENIEQRSVAVRDTLHEIYLGRP
jgi:hypothetical protein